MPATLHAEPAASPTLSGLARALIVAEKLPAKVAEDLYRKSLSTKTSFI